jgi:hypothetical protein
MQRVDDADMWKGALLTYTYIVRHRFMYLGSCTGSMCRDPSGLDVLAMSIFKWALNFDLNVNQNFKFCSGITAIFIN